MNREIGFRAWDKKHRKYAKVLKIYFGSCGHILGALVEDYDTNYAFELQPEQFVLEQDTGLDDRNGKKIYEGDIVSKEYAGGDTQPLVVHFDKAEAQFQIGGFGIDPTRVEVIGNIHEIELKENRNVEMVKRILKGNDE